MVIGSESETVEFKLTTGEKNEAVEAMAAILNKHCRDSGVATKKQCVEILEFTL